MPDKEQVDARDRESASEEDPMAQREAEKLHQPDEVAPATKGFKFYGSVRVRNRTTGSANVWDDDGSRAGLNWQSTTKESHSWFAHAEYGFNIFSEVNRWLYPGGSPTDTSSSLFNRLAYVGYETPKSYFIVGKNWSTYYQVASFTDRFDGTGGNASGAFNAGTDGGATGTGRADNLLQSRYQTGPLTRRLGIKPIKVNAQVQYGNSIPGVASEKYALGIGLSSVIQSRDDLAFGIAYNHSQLANPGAPALTAAGIDGDTQALLLGARHIGKKWFLGTTLSRTMNLHTTDQGVYFDGLGWEVYGNFQVTNKFWLVGGWNYLVPDTGETQAGQYRIRYGIVGLRYSLRGLDRTVYTELQYSDGRAADGSSFGNIFTVGLRWDLP